MMRTLTNDQKFIVCCIGLGVIFCGAVSGILLHNLISLIVLPAIGVIIVGAGLFWKEKNDH